MVINMVNYGQCFLYKLILRRNFSNTIIIGFKINIYYITICCLILKNIILKLLHKSRTAYHANISFYFFFYIMPFYKGLYFLFRDEEREKELLKSSSEESMRRRTSSSADSVLSSNNSPLMGPSGNPNTWPPGTTSDMQSTTIATENSSNSGVIPAVVTNVPCISSTQPIISREVLETTV